MTRRYLALSRAELLRSRIAVAAVLWSFLTDHSHFVSSLRKVEVIRVFNGARARLSLPDLIEFSLRAALCIIVIFIFWINHFLCRLAAAFVSLKPGKCFS